MNPQNIAHVSILDAILSAGPVVQLTLLILIGLSVLCWAVAFAKQKQFKLLEEQNPQFVDAFWKAASLDSLYESALQKKDSSIARVFITGYLELQRLAENPKGGGMHANNITNLERSMRKASDEELAKLESRLNILATTGSTGPFIGLFGTVWGIMSAFQKIGAMGSASLAVVAPGIAEALVATAVGLAAAIPAVVLYNRFVTKVKKQEMELNNFSTDFLNIAQRNFFSGSSEERGDHHQQSKQ